MIRTWAVRAAAAGLVAAALGALYAHLRDMQRMMITDVMSAAFNDGVTFGKSTALLQAALDEPPAEVGPFSGRSAFTAEELETHWPTGWGPPLGRGEAGGCG